MFIKYSSSLDDMFSKLQAFKMRCLNFEEKLIKLKNLIQIIKQYYQNFFDICLPNFIVSFRYVCIVVLFLLGIGGFIFMFLKPGIKLVDSTTSFKSTSNRWRQEHKIVLLFPQISFFES